MIDKFRTFLFALRLIASWKWSFRIGGYVFHSLSRSWTSESRYLPFLPWGVGWHKVEREDESRK